MVEIKLTFATLDEAIAYLAKGTPTIAPQPDPKPEKAARAPKPDAKHQADSAATGNAPATASTAVSATSTPADTETVEVPTYEKSGISEKITGYVGGKDTEGYAERRQQILDLLAEFKVANGKLLKPEQFTPFLAKLNALSGPETALG